MIKEKNAYLQLNISTSFLNIDIKIHIWFVMFVALRIVYATETETESNYLLEMESWKIVEKRYITGNETQHPSLFPLDLYYHTLFTIMKTVGLKLNTDTSFPSYNNFPENPLFLTHLWFILKRMRRNLQWIGDKQLYHILGRGFSFAGHQFFSF